MKTILIVTSALKPSIGAYSFEERYNQTIATLDCLRAHIPNCTIVFADVSISSNAESQLNEIRKRCDVFLNMNDDPIIMQLSRSGMKSHAETAMLLKVFHILKNDSSMRRILSQCDRVFKISSRSMLTEDFKLSDHDMPGKFVFWKRSETWMPTAIMNATHSLTTRFYSLCGSLVDDYINTLILNIKLLNVGLDTEHAHFVNINPNLLIELPTLGCYAYVAGPGKIEHY